MQYNKYEQFYKDIPVTGNPKLTRNLTPHSALADYLKLQWHALKSAVEWKVMLLVTALCVMLCVGESESRSKVYTLNVSAYNSLAAQTDSTPNITATGTRTRPGVLAVSRNLLGRSDLPYGTRVKAVAQSGCGLNVVGRIFTVEDTMAARMSYSADIWMSSSSAARKFGRCLVTFQKV